MSYSDWMCPRTDGNYSSNLGNRGNQPQCLRAWIQELYGYHSPANGHAMIIKSSER